MSNTILILKGANNEEIRIAADKIISYIPVGAYARISIPVDEFIDVQHSVDEIDLALAESYFMIKRVTTSELE